MHHPELEDSILNTFRRNAGPLFPEPTGIEPVIKALPDIRGVVFDVYGTLFVSRSGDIGTTQTTNSPSHIMQAYAQAQLGALTEDEASLILTDFYAAIRETHAEHNAAGVAFPEVNIIDIWNTVTKERYGFPALVHLASAYESLSNCVWPMPGTNSMLKFMKKRGIIMGIVSNAQFYTPYLFPALLCSRLEDLGIPRNRCIWSYEVGQAKPAKTLFSLLYEQLLKDSAISSPGQLLYLGNDMLNDIYGAQNAGMRTALFAGDKGSLRLRRDDERCRGIQPDVILTGLDQLSQVVPSA